MTEPRYTSYQKTLPNGEPLYLIDFFCGCGGMSWGFQNTRQSHLYFKVLAGIDIDVNALATYEENVGAPGLNYDIGKIGDQPELLTEIVPGFNPEFLRPLVFVGGPPCQGFSAHRKKDDRDDPRNQLLFKFAKICTYYKPDFIVIENVPEIFKGRFSGYFNVAAEEITKYGYTLNGDVLDVSLFGVAQRRKRAIVIGSLKGLVKLPQPVFPKDQPLTVRDAISHLPNIAAGQEDQFVPNHKAPLHTTRILERIKKTPPDGGDRRSLSLEEQLACHTNLDNGRTPGFTDVYGRLRWDTPSVTITAKSSTPSCGRFLHPDQHRNISVREAATLQGFPQSFIFKGPFVNQYRQVGEAVPPLFARFLAWEVLNALRQPDSRPPEIFERKHEFTYSTNSSKSNNGVKLVDAFCGAGGLSLGFETAGFSSVYAFDIDTDSVATFKSNISDVVKVRDVRSQDTIAEINASIGSDPYVIVGGPPCQGFSQQRRGSNDDDRNNLVLSYANLIKKLNKKPIAVVLENVTYLDSPRGRKILAEFVRELEMLHFVVIRHDLNSAEFGVPQLRHRIIVVAMDENLVKYYKGPQPLTAKRWVTVGEVLATLPRPNDPIVKNLQIKNHEVSNEGPLNKRRISFVDMGKGRLMIPPDLQLPCHTAYDGHLDVYGRLDWFSQARTITVGFDSFTRGEFAHPFYHRSITHREGARIQGFPDWFQFIGNRASVRRQIGNAVPPSLSFAIAKAINEAIECSKEQLNDFTANNFYVR